MENKLIWYIFCPGCAFKGAIIKTRKTWLLGIQHLVMWRNDIYNKRYCTLEWISDDLVFDRNKIT
jgi:hypothetical protein